MSDHAPSPERITAVAGMLGRIDLSLAGPGAVAAAERTRRLLAEYLAPRVSHPGDDLVVALVGLSGSGKSTLLNSLARRRLSETGTRRPTTLQPVAWGHDALPATLDAVRRRIPGRMVDALRPPPDGVVLLDTPPPDVLGPDGSPVCHHLVDVADVVLFVADARRYADAAGFALAERAAERGVALSFILNRLPPTAEVQRTLVGDFATKLARRGLVARAEPGAVLAVVEGPTSAEREGLSSEAVLSVRKELDRIADPGERRRIVAAAVAGSTEVAGAGLATVRAGLVAAESRRVELADPVLLAYSGVAAGVMALIRSGDLATLDGDADGFAATLAAAVARRSGRAASGAAERWELLGADTATLFTHGDSTPAEARDRIAWWESDLPRLAAELGGPRERGRRAQQLVASVRASVVDPAHSPRRRERRMLRRHPQLMEAAWRRLAEELDGIVAADAARFTTRLAPVAPPGALADLSLEDRP